MRTEKNVDRPKWSRYAEEARKPASKKQGTPKRGGAHNETGRKPAVVRMGKQERGRKRREEPETRVDVMTPQTGRPLSPSTAARIRAKVEAKLAEREAMRK